MRKNSPLSFFLYGLVCAIAVEFKFYGAAVLFANLAIWEIARYSVQSLKARDCGRDEDLEQSEGDVL